MARDGFSNLVEEGCGVELQQLYLYFIECSKLSSDNGGFDWRDKIGYAVSRAFMVHPRQVSEAYFGTTLLNIQETFDYDYAEYTQIEGAKKALDQLVEKLSDHPKVAFYLANVPNDKVTGRFATVQSSPSVKGPV